MFTNNQPIGTAAIALIVGIYGLFITIMSIIGVASGGTVMSILFIVMGLAWLALGVGLWTHANWARITAIILIAVDTVTAWFDGFQLVDTLGLALAAALIAYLLYDDNVQLAFNHSST